MLVTVAVSREIHEKVVFNKKKEGCLALAIVTTLVVFEWLS